MHTAYLGLGSNIGDKKKFLYDAIKYLYQHEHVVITKLSSLYETVPWGYTDQDIFMNLVVEIETTLNPFELLDLCQEVENSLGRVREFKWGPRVIDVDVLLYDEEVIQHERLILPHPYMLERDFVMIPLAEVNSNLVVNHQKVSDVAKRFDLNLIKKVSTTLDS